MATDAQQFAIRFSPHYRSVCWRGQTYSFSKTQAIAFGVLMRCWADGVPDVAGDYLLNAIDSDATNLCDLFRQHPAWNTIIVPGATRGTRRLEGEPPKDIFPFDEMSDGYSMRLDGPAL